MSKILIIPDVHARPFWEKAVEKYNNEADKIIFLGDEVDPYKEEGFTRKEAIRTLEKIIEFKLNNKDKTVLLIGNHAAHYFIKNFPRSTRYDSSNAYKIKQLYLQHKSLFKVAHQEIVNNKKYLFTHAGLMNSWVERNKDIIGEPTADNLNILLNTPRGIEALGDVSFYRSYFGEKSGSILWSDIREKIDNKSEEDNIIPNEDSIVNVYDYQIFGHTMLTKPIITDKWACLDTKQAFMLDDGTIKEIIEQ